MASFAENLLEQFALLFVAAFLAVCSEKPLGFSLRDSIQHALTMVGVSWDKIVDVHAFSVSAETEFVLVFDNALFQIEI